MGEAHVVAISLPVRPRGETILLAFRPPRTTFLATFPGDDPFFAAQATAREAAGDATVVMDNAFEMAKALREDFRIELPGTELLRVEPSSLRRFFWCYRDGHDPFALGHASNRTLFKEGYDQREVPSPRHVRGRRARRHTLALVRKLVLDTGFVLGVRPPLPRPDSKAWGQGKLARLYDTCLALYAGLLHRWRSPLAVLPEPGRLILADRWLRERDPSGIAASPTCRD